jgi:hypothetical protein
MQQHSASHTMITARHLPSIVQGCLTRPAIRGRDTCRQYTRQCTVVSHSVSGEARQGHVLSSKPQAISGAFRPLFRVHQAVCAAPRRCMRCRGSHCNLDLRWTAPQNKVVSTFWCAIICMAAAYVNLSISAIMA